MKKHQSSILDIIKKITIGLGIVFLGLLIKDSWHQLSHNVINWPLLFFSSIIGISVNLIVSFFFFEFLRKYGYQGTYTIAQQLFFYSQIVKYVPGKIWSLIYQSMTLKSPNSVVTILHANIDLTITTVVITSSISAALLFHHVPFITIMFFSAGLIICYLINKSCVLFDITKIFVDKIGPYSLCVCTPKIERFRIILLYLLFWVSYIMSNFSMLYAVFGFTFQESLIYIGCLGLGWVVGVITVIAPAGLGVRELVFLFFANNITNSEVSFATLGSVAIVSRFWLVIQEVLGAVIVFISQKRLHRYLIN